ncbi:MAG: ABC transporter substrate-binding protein [Cetobacterium sp.]|uniref:ABC transporter substrate-binding protein n=1 Tax=Cetobacterium sp. TaxID=2071632 RepID=UPI003F356750
MVKILVLMIFLNVITYSKIFVDGMNRKVDIPLNIKRVVSTVPSNTEILVDMELVDILVGVDIYSENISEKLKGKGISKTDKLNEEKIIELMPDLIIASHHNLIRGKESITFFEEVGIPVYIIKNSETLDDISNSIIEIGNILNRNLAAENLKIEYEKELEKLKQEKPLENKRVYFEIFDNPLYTTGKDTFINDILEIGGGKNIFSDVKGWIMPSLEKILSRDPEIILLSRDSNSKVEDILNRSEWQEVSAIKNKRVYYIDESINRPSPRVVRALEDIRNQLENNEI